ncbi:unnamed protein product [Natator depressus]
MGKTGKQPPACIVEQLLWILEPSPAVQNTACSIKQHPAGEGCKPSSFDPSKWPDRLKVLNNYKRTRYSQDVDCVYMAKMELEAKVERLKQETEFLRCVYAEFQELQEAKGIYCNDLKCNWHEIAELRRLIQRLQSDSENVKKQTICDAEQQGDCALKDGQEKYVELQHALQKAQDELASMLRDYQELRHVKLALDIKIAAYKTLLEGEENRWLRRTGVGCGGMISVNTRRGWH